MGRTKQTYPSWTNNIVSRSDGRAVYAALGLFYQKMEYDYNSHGSTSRAVYFYLEVRIAPDTVEISCSFCIESPKFYKLFIYIISVHVKHRVLLRGTIN